MARPQGHSLSRYAFEDISRLQGVSQKKVADMAGLSPATLSCITTGRRRASVPLAYRIAEALDCHPQTLFPSLSRLHSEAVAS